MRNATGLTQMIQIPKERDGNTSANRHLNAYRRGVREHLMKEGGREEASDKPLFHSLLHYKEGPEREAIKKSTRGSSVML